MNLYSVHMDENYWNDHEMFQAERHLSADGTSLIKTDHLLPFGAGKSFRSLLKLIFKNSLFGYLNFFQVNGCV